MNQDSTPQTPQQRMQSLWESHPNQKRYRRWREQRCMVDEIVVGEDACEARTYGGPKLCAKHAEIVARLRKVKQYERPKPLPVDPRVQEANRRVIALQNETLELKREIRRLKAIKEPERPEKRKRTEDGHVYFLQSDNAVKIGWTSDLEQRMKSYSPGAKILAVMPGTRKDETHLHRKFAHLRTNRREWFAYSPQVMEEVAWIVREHGDPPRDLNEPMTTTRIVGPRLNRPTQRRARSLNN